MDSEAESSAACIEKKARREQVSRKQNKTKDDILCLFREKPASHSKPLHEAMAKVIGERVKRCATKILDQLLTKGILLLVKQSTMQSV